MAAPAGYLQPQVVTFAQAPPARKSLLLTLLKAGVVGGVVVGGVFVTSKVLQSLTPPVSVGCPTNLFGLWPFCGKVGTPPPTCSPPCSSSQTCQCVGSTCSCVSSGGGGAGPASSVVWDAAEGDVFYRICQATENGAFGGTSCCGSPGVAVCPYPGAVSGTVVDRNGTPVPNAILTVATSNGAGFTVVDSQGRSISQITSDANGKIMVNLAPNSLSTPGTDCSGTLDNQVRKYAIGLLGFSNLASPSSLTIYKLEYWCEYNLNYPNCPGNCDGYNCGNVAWDQSC